MKLLGAILAGGQATRFGSDKALAVLNGRSLIDHAAAALQSTVDATIVCGRDAVPPDLIGVPDWPDPGLGPLGGLCAALRYAAAHHYDAVLSIGCDTPFLPAPLIARLVAGPGAQFLRQAPIIGCWPVGMAGNLSRHLTHGQDRAVYRWATAAGARAIETDIDLPNINRTDDLDAIMPLHGSGGSL